MYHSMTIIPDGISIYTNGKLNGINTWDDWHLMPSSRPLIEVPGIKTAYIDIPGSDGSFDLTEAFTERPLYSNRGGSFEFYVMNGYGSWATRYSAIMNYLHGRRVKLILEDDPGYYYNGRMSVNKWQSVKDWSRITLDYNFEPFKYKTKLTGESWLWDPFNFETDMTTDGYISKITEPSRLVYTDLPIEGSTNVTVYLKISNRNSNEVNLHISSIDKNGTPLQTIDHELRSDSTMYSLDQQFKLSNDVHRMRAHITTSGTSSGDHTSVDVIYNYQRKSL